MQKFANIVLLAITIGAVYNHSALRHPVEDMFSALGVGSLLVVRYVMHSRAVKLSLVRHKATSEAESNGDASSVIDEKTD